VTASIADPIRTLARTRRGLPSPAERRRIRQAARVPQQAVADALGVTRQAVSGWESGQTPRDNVLAGYLAILNALRCELGETLECVDA
jgi:transcriptional regulator with XRE-family HTH domain